jgi:hypothetical protein
MPDYSTDLDSAPTQDTGQVTGWLVWHAAPTEDGVHGAGTFSLRTRDSNATIDLTRGFIPDWPNAKTGWERWDTATRKFERQWNKTRNVVEPQPPGAGWKRAILLPIAIDLERRALWQQASFAAWQALVGILAICRDHNAVKQIPQLPVLSHLGAVPELGGASLVPTFGLMRFAAAPACLIATTNGDARPQAPPPTSTPTWDAPRLTDDDIPF